MTLSMTKKQEAAALLGCSSASDLGTTTHHLRKLVAAGQLPEPVKIGKHVFFDTKTAQSLLRVVKGESPQQPTRAVTSVVVPDHWVTAAEGEAQFRMHASTLNTWKARKRITCIRGSRAGGRVQDHYDPAEIAREMPEYRARLAGVKPLITAKRVAIQQSKGEIKDRIEGYGKTRSPAVTSSDVTPQQHQPPVASNVLETNVLETLRRRANDECKRRVAAESARRAMESQLAIVTAERDEALRILSTIVDREPAQYAPLSPAEWEIEVTPAERDEAIRVLSTLVDEEPQYEPPISPAQRAEDKRRLLAAVDQLRRFDALSRLELRAMFDGLGLMLYGGSYYHRGTAVACFPTSGTVGLTGK